MFEFKLDDWSIIKNIFSNINKIIDEIVVECTDDGLNFIGIDRGHVCFFEGVISKDLFDYYELEKGMLLYIDLEEFVRVLKRGKNKDSLVFEADDEQYIVYFKNKNTRKFSITQLSDVMNSRKPPVLDYGTKFSFEYDSLKDTLKDAELYSDRLTIIREDDVVVFSCEGNSGNYSNEFYLDENVVEGFSSTYSVSWLLKIFDTKLSSEDIVINMGQDFPMLIEMSDVDNVKMSYLLAPILDNGE